MKSLVFLMVGFGAGFLTAFLLKEAEKVRGNDADRLVTDIERRFESLEVEPAHP